MKSSLPAGGQKKRAGRGNAYSNGLPTREALSASILVSLFVFLILLPQVLHFSKREEVERHIWNSLPFWSTLENWELSLLDRRFVTRGALVPHSRDRIAIVGVDETSIATRGQWPFPRRWHGQLVKNLHRAGAKVSGLDFGFDSYQGRNETGQTLSPDDAALAADISHAGNVVLVSRLEAGSKTSGAAHTTLDSLATPVDELDSLTPDLGISYVPRDNDGAVRRYPFTLVKPPEAAPLGGFAPLCVAVFQGLAHGDDLSRYQSALRSGQWPSLGVASSAVPLTENVFPGDLGSRDKTRVWTTPLWLYGPPQTFPTYSYSDVLGWNDAQLRRAFGGRIVLVGATAPVLKDVFPIPAFDSGQGQPVETEIPGVELHATMAAMLLDGDFLFKQSRSGMLMTLLTLIFGASIWMVLIRGPVAAMARHVSVFWVRRGLPGRVHDTVLLGLYAGLGTLPVFLFWQWCEWELSARHLWVVAAYPMIGAALASVGMLSLFFGNESAERRKTMTQMARIVAPDVMEEILAHPEAEYPRPRRVSASILFTDLDDFTAYAAARDPEEVVNDLNAFLTRMHPIIAAHGGCIDKYIGDSVMAFFGAPLARPDHAAQALRCAIALQDECARFRDQTRVPFWMRIGIHSGEVLVGSIGSEQQFNYTVMGDVVNLASRLEAKNKEFGSRIMCSAETFAAAPDVARAQRAQAQIRGKNSEIEVVMVRGPQNEPPRGVTWGDSLVTNSSGQSVVDLKN